MRFVNQFFYSRAMAEDKPIRDWMYKNSIKEVREAIAAGGFEPVDEPTWDQVPMYTWVIPGEFDEDGDPRVKVGAAEEFRVCMGYTPPEDSWTNIWVKLAVNVKKVSDDNKIEENNDE